MCRRPCAVYTCLILDPCIPPICTPFRGDDRNRTGVDGFAGGPEGFSELETPCFRGSQFCRVPVSAGGTREFGETLVETFRTRRGARSCLRRASRRVSLLLLATGATARPSHNQHGDGL